jgi:hypothetical protein
VTIDEFDAFLDTTTPEQLTLYLARMGRGCEFGLDFIMARRP